MAFGILSGRSLMLSESGRALKEPYELQVTENRLSRNLRGGRLHDDSLEKRHLGRVSRWTLANQGEGVVVAVDYTDICKRRRGEARRHTSAEAPRRRR